MGETKDSGSVTEHDIIVSALKITGLFEGRACPACGLIRTSAKLSLIETVQLPNKFFEFRVLWRYVAISCVQCGRTDFFDYMTLLEWADALTPQADQTDDKS